MDLIDREQLMNYIRSKKINIGKLSHDIIMKQKSVNAVSEEVYTREYNLRKDAEFKVYKLEKALEKKPILDKIRAEVEAYQSDAFYPDNVMMSKRMVLEIIDKYRKGE